MNQDSTSKTCKNCGADTHGNYCSNCGQDTHSDRIDFHLLWHDLMHGILHMDHGILFTLKALFTRPGHMIREYLEGKRVKHFKPFSMLIVLATLYAFINHSFHLSVVDHGRSHSPNELEKVEWIYEYLDHHYAFGILFMVPVFSLVFFLLFRKTYNYFEWLICFGYIMTIQVILQILVLPVYHLVPDSAYDLVGNLSSLLNILIVSWVILQLFQYRQPVWVLLKSLLGYILSFGLMIILLIIILLCI